MIFEPLDFIARLAALVPKPRANHTRFHGVFAPNSKHRAVVVTRARRGKKKPTTDADETPAEHRAAMRTGQSGSNGSSTSISTPAANASVR